MSKTYDPKQVKISFFGIPISGFAEGTFITATPSGDRFSKAVGADGEVGRAKSNNNTHEVTLTLLQVSPSNDVLNGFLQADKLTNAGKGPLQIVDLSGTTVMMWKDAWIKTPPDVELGNEIGERAWVFDTGQIVEEAIGGNND